MPCFICSSDDNVQHSYALVPGNLEEQTASEVVKATSNTMTHYLQQTHINPSLHVSMSNVPIGNNHDEMMEETTTLQNQQPLQNEWPQLISTEEDVKRSTVGSSSDLHTLPHIKSYSSSVPIGMYLEMHIIINYSYICTLVLN